MTACAALPDDFSGLDKVDGIVIVLGHTSGNGQNVHVEDNVLRREVALLGQDFESTLADPYLVFYRRCLALLIEGHHDHSGTILENLPRLGLEFLLSTFQ